MLYPTAIKLPFQFSPTLLSKDLAKVSADAWIRHYRESNYKGDWGIVALRAVHGHPACIYASPATNTPDFYQNTPLLNESPYFQKVIDSFQCQVNATRLMRLSPQAEILEHSDDMGNDENAEVRIHIPIQTNPKIQFYINHKLIKMQAGEVWFGNFNLPHSVKNESEEHRIHFVLDCTLNEWLAKQISEATSFS